MGLITGTSDVFSFLRDFYGCLPVAVRLLMHTAFGGMVFICILRNINR